MFFAVDATNPSDTFETIFTKLPQPSSEEACHYLAVFAHDEAIDRGLWFMVESLVNHYPDETYDSLKEKTLACIDPKVCSDHSRLHLEKIFNCQKKAKDLKNTVDKNFLYESFIALCAWINS